MSKTRNNGRWTEARFRSFIISALRKATYRWPPKGEVVKQASTGRGRFRCAMCKKDCPTSLPAEDGGKRIRNRFVDHIVPIVDPQKGFTTYDDWINRCFVDSDGLQVLCKACHDAKTQEERRSRKK
jgi:hypothetical protein